MLINWIFNIPRLIRVNKWWENWIKECDKNWSTFEKKIKEIKPVKDYKLYKLTITESMWYPEGYDMLQYVWLDDKDSIKIAYQDENDYYTISLEFEERSILIALELVQSYINLSFTDERLEVFIYDKVISIHSWGALQKILKRNDEEILWNIQDNGKSYVSIHENVYADLDQCLCVINQTKNVTNIDIRINKLKTEEDDIIISHLVSHVFSYESLLFEEGYLASLETKRINKFDLKRKNEKKN